MVNTNKGFDFFVLLIAFFICVFIPGFSKGMAATISSLEMQSDKGDWVGQGKTYSYPLSNAKVTVNTLDLNKNGLVDRIDLNIASQSGTITDRWNLSFGTDKVTGKDLNPGFYENAQRASFAQAGHPGLDVSGLGRGSSMVTGNFTIIEAKFDYSVPSSPKLVSFAAIFEQHSEGNTPALRGRIYYNYTPKLSFLGMQSDKGDWVGQGMMYWYPLSNANVRIYTLDINKNGSVDRINFILNPQSQSNTGTDNWNVSFSTDKVGKDLSPGFYENAQRAPFAEAGHPGLEISGMGRGSNKLTGNFTIIEAQFDYSVPSSPKLVSFTAIFEQHSEGKVPALKGAISYSN